ncbi:hypothetical protein ACIQWQ_11145 [Peribacillus frigoritolerans]
MKGNTIEVLEVKEDSEKTIIRIRISYNKNPEPNPYIAVALTGSYAIRSISL